MTDLLEYVRSSLRRVETGDLDSQEGSHMSGVFGRAANRFENEVKTWAKGLLHESGIDYDTQLRGQVEAGPQFSRLTLGNVVFVLRKAAKLSENRGNPPLTLDSELLPMIAKINKTWVNIKHGEEPPKTELVDRLRKMERAITQIRVRP
jgi:hypothetical protein